MGTPLPLQLADSTMQRAIVSTIQLTPDLDLGRIKETLQRFADAGFDDAVVLIRPGGPTPAQVRALVR